MQLTVLTDRSQGGSSLSDGSLELMVSGLSPHLSQGPSTSSLPALYISRQEHWSGLPFPSMHESESVAHSCPILRNPMDVALQDPLTMEFPRQQYWSGFLFPTSGDLPRSGIKPLSPA